jgi:hypothetical protein
MARFPKPYLNEIPEAGKAPGIEYVPLHNMDIGARKSGMPDRASNGPGGISHVGGSATGGK